MENIYDAENLRSISIENGKYNRYVYSGSSIACEVDEDWGLKDRVVRGHTILQREDSNKDTYYYIHNAHGDITALTDGTGEVVNNYSYDAFGNILDSVEKVDNRFKYSGELHDPVTDQYYLRARYYNPSIGRFMQEDTFSGDGLNLYTYVSNNPIKYIDPTGHCKEGVNFSDGSGNILGTNLDNVIKKIPLIERILGYFNNVEVGNTYNVESEFLSDEYFDELNALYSKVKKENNKWGIFGNGKEIAAEAVINQMMDDLEANPDALVGNANYKRFFDTFDQNITQLDSITERMHYFRNTLNSYGGAPTDLEGMIEMAAKGEWELFSTIGTAYHRYDYDGVQGALNVKFVSADGRFEAVYNTGTGKMVTDPANMGTYNYAPASSVVGFFKHNKCDVEPFEKWGNTSELSYEDIKNLKSGHMTITAHTNHNTVKELIKMRKKELTTEK